MNAPYQVMARSMRPQRFEEVVGQEKIKQTLMNAQSMNRLGHAYLFSGPHGTGKTTLARLFAKALNCDALEKGEPCNLCASCKEITSCRSLNVIEIDGASNRGIDDIRQINETVNFSAQAGKYKIYIIDEVHMLTKEAFNALLKTLEDPPKQVKFFFATTERHKMPETILSRCQCFFLEPVNEKEVIHHLMSCSLKSQIELKENAAEVIAKRTYGSLRDALVLTDQLIAYAGQTVELKHVEAFLGLMPKEAFFKFDEGASRGEPEAAILLSQHLFETGISLSNFLDSFAEHFRQILYIQVFKKNPPCLSLSSDEWLHYEKSAQLYSYEQCLHITDLILEAQLKLKTFLSKKLAIENLLLEITRSFNRITPESLLEQIQALKAPTSLTNAGETKAPETPSKTQKEIPQPVESKPIENIQKINTSPQAPAIKGSAKKEKNRYDTLMQFAAVELEGSLKKEG